MPIPWTPTRLRKGPRRLFPAVAGLLVWIFSIPALSQVPLPNPPPGAGPTQERVIRMAYPGLECEYCYAYAQAAYEEAFGRLGYAVEIVSLPSQRALILSNSGVLDGEVSRLSGFDPHGRYPNLLQVPEPVFLGKISAYTLGDGPEIEGWHSLAEGAFLVVYQHGILLVHKRLREWVPAARRISVASTIQGLRFLRAGRAKVYVELSKNLRSVHRLAEFQNLDLRKAAPLETVPGHPYLHKRNADLVSPLARTFRAMKADGTLAELRRAIRSKDTGAPAPEAGPPTDAP